MEQDSVNQRLNILVDTFESGIKAAFARKVGITSQGAQEILAGRRGDPSFKVLVKILESYPQVCSDWLVLGRGPMLREKIAKQRALTLEEEAEVAEFEEIRELDNDKVLLSIEDLRKQLMEVAHLALSPKQAELLKQKFPDSFPPVAE